MKKLLSLTFGVIFSAVAIAQPPAGPATSGMTFGQKTVATGAIDVNQLAGTVKDEAETPVKVKGKVIEVCTMEGCWLKMQTASGNLMVKMKNHSFLVPVDINGKQVVVDGTAKMKVNSVKELQHYAEDANKSKEEIAAIKSPKTEIVLNADGILVL
jgi:hypothetical protein